MAVTDFRRDHLLRRVVDPGGTALDHLGRETTATVDHLGRLLVAKDWPGAVAVTAGAFYDIAASRIVYQVTISGNAAAAAPAVPPGVGNTIASGTATIRQLTKS